MNEKDKSRFAEIMFGLADNFSAEINKHGLKFRFSALGRFSIEQVEHAANEIALSRKFTKMPTIAEFIERIEGSDQDQAELQVEKIWAEVRRIGSNGSPKFDDPVTAHVVASRFGWGRICATLDKDRPFFVKDFMEAYSCYAREEKRQELLSGPTNPHVLKLVAGIGG